MREAEIRRQEMTNFLGKVVHRFLPDRFRPAQKPLLTIDFETEKNNVLQPISLITPEDGQNFLSTLDSLLSRRNLQESGRNAHTQRFVRSDGKPILMCDLGEAKGLTIYLLTGKPLVDEFSSQQRIPQKQVKLFKSALSAKIHQAKRPS